MTEPSAALVWEGLLLTVPFAALPIVATAHRLRLGVWVFLALTPAFMYHKVMLLPLGSIDWPTLGKDAAAAILAICLAVHPVSRHLFRTEWRRFTLPLVVLGWTFAFLGPALGIGGTTTAIALRAYLFYVALGVLAGAFLLREARASRTLAILLAAVGVSLSALALVHRFVDPDVLIHSSMKTLWNGVPYDWFTYRERLRSIFSNANLLGFFAALGIVNLTWLAFSAQRIATRVVLTFMATAVVFPALLLTLSRSAVLALIAAMLVLATGVLRERAIPFLGIGALLVVAALQTGAYAGRLGGLTDNPRLIIWGAHIEATIGSPLRLAIGHGPGSVGRSGRTTRTSDVDITGIAARLGVPSDRVHFVDNAFVKAFYEAGFLGIAYITWLGQFFVLAVRSLARAELPHDRLVRALPAAIMTHVLVISLFTDALMTYPWSLLYGLAAGGALAAQQAGAPRAPTLASPCGAQPSLQGGST